MYGVISSSGKTLIPIALQQVYSETSGGKNTYYMVYNNQTVNILETLEKSNSKNKTNTQDNNTQDTNNTTISNTTDNK